jgi:hypothetical protein
MKPLVAGPRLRFFGVITACVLPLVAFTWFFRHKIEEASDRSWLIWLALAMLTTATLTAWFRMRHLPSMRPWLLRHMIGNIMLAIALIAAWFYNAPASYFVLIVLGVFAMWIWGNRKLREGVLNRETTR